MSILTPAQTVKELDKYIIGQDEAKKAVAVALRNRYRRMQLPEEIREEVTPKNILMMGPTGVGKTEIARRLAKLVDAPFVKVEATKFTEVGYVGRDVDSIIRDLTEAGIRLVKQQQVDLIHDMAVQAANNRIVELLVKSPNRKKPNPIDLILGNKPKEPELPPEEQAQLAGKREDIRRQLEAGLLEDTIVEVEVEQKQPQTEVPGTGGMNISDMMGGMLPKKMKQRKVPVKEARRILTAEEEDSMVDMDQVYTDAIARVEQHGIVFIDEIDKVAGKGSSHGPDVSREGVQRDILPIVEGCTVSTKYGPVRTDHILFIAAGAFHVARVTDLIPELQGRFPVRVELQPLTVEDYRRILTQPKNALIRQYQALLKVDGVDLQFDDSAIEEIAKFAYDANESNENIGARRLHTVLEKLLSDIAFNAGGGDAPEITVPINGEYIKSRLSKEATASDLHRFIL